MPTTPASALGGRAAGVPLSGRPWCVLAAAPVRETRGPCVVDNANETGLLVQREAVVLFCPPRRPGQRAQPAFVARGRYGTPITRRRRCVPAAVPAASALDLYPTHHGRPKPQEGTDLANVAVIEINLSAELLELSVRRGLRETTRGPREPTNTTRTRPTARKGGFGRAPSPAAPFRRRPTRGEPHRASDQAGRTVSARGMPVAGREPPTA